MPANDYPKYEVTLKLCTLYKGVPYGPAYIEYTHPDPDNKYISFETRYHMQLFAHHLSNYRHMLSL